MDKLRLFQNTSWIKPDWCFPSMTRETNELLKQCSNLPNITITDDVDEVISKSKAFPIPFPIESVRLEKLKVRRPVEKLKSNIVSTYPIIHERVLFLITHFLIYKREFGTSIEKAMYKDMTIAEFIDRLLKKRAVTFLNEDDSYKLLSGEQDVDGWELVGTLQQKPPLVLQNCLSYDEMKISAMLYVSGQTECINNGARDNVGVVNEDTAESDAVIIGIIGARFERKFRMDYEDILITPQQNVIENGYGEEVTPTSCLTVLRASYGAPGGRQAWRQLWAEFYQTPSYTYWEVGEESRGPRFVPVPGSRLVFDNELYYKRTAVCADCCLLEADRRARDSRKKAFLNVIGAGLGVWKVSDHQRDVYILTFLERIRALLKREMINHVSDVNFAYIRPNETVLALFTNSSDVQNDESAEKKLFFESKKHPDGGINVQLENREPSSKLTGEHAGKLLVMTYPWDGNAHPGNEFWIGSLSGSGDPAAACSTQVAELHNAHINDAVTGANTKVIGREGVKTLAEYCRILAQ